MNTFRNTRGYTIKNIIRCRLSSPSNSFSHTYLLGVHYVSGTVLDTRYILNVQQYIQFPGSKLSCSFQD